MMSAGGSLRSPSLGSPRPGSRRRGSVRVVVTMTVDIVIACE